MMNFEVGLATNKGLTRSLNEDSVLKLEYSSINEDLISYLGLFGVADGMGGGIDGHIMSKLALKLLATNMIETVFLPLIQRDSTLSSAESSLSVFLSKSIGAINRDLFQYAKTKGGDMGTTLITALVVGSRVYIANVGDSRCYTMEGGKIRRVTTDHSLVAALVASGDITPDQAYTHPERNMITRCLGLDQEVKVDVFAEEFHFGTSLLLCSDGLWEMVRDEEIAKIINQSAHPNSICDHLMKTANRNGGLDNISIMLIRPKG